MADDSMTSWRNRIIETRTVLSAELTANPRNWRRHPDSQAKVLRGLLSDVGIVTPLIAYHSARNGGLTAGVIRLSPSGMLSLTPRGERLLARAG